jgi:membrane-associated phospholipid phosphatase
MNERCTPYRPFEYWVLAPPLLALLLITVLHFAGNEKQIFLTLNQAGEFAGDLFWIFLTTLGDGLVGCVLILPFIRRQPGLAWLMLLAWLFAGLWSKALKNLTDVPRPLSVLAPADIHVIGLPYRFHSMPSGHTAIAAALAASFCLYYRQRWLQVSIIALALMVGFSRIAIGVHWITDVLGGFGGGWLLAVVAFFLARRLRFGLSRAARIVYGTILFGAAVRMLLINHTDYPQAFRLQQTIALVCILFTIVGIYLSVHEKRGNKLSD